MHLIGIIHHHMSVMELGHLLTRSGLTSHKMDFERDGHAQIQHFALNYQLKKRREFNLETHLLFIDYEKASDNIQRQILFNILKSSWYYFKNKIRTYKCICVHNKLLLFSSPKRLQVYCSLKANP